jgi:hypothetical protein
VSGNDAVQLDARQPLKRRADAGPFSGQRRIFVVHLQTPTQNIHS